jgi:uncharacterized protein
MPIPLTYPGVYVEEVPSGVRTITGVPTSIAAFVGRAQRGPIDEPKTVFNFGEFSSKFGGLANEFPMSFAVRDFFANGGGQAVIVRAFRPTSSTTVSSATFSLPSSSSTTILGLKAAEPGAWGQTLTVQANIKGLPTANASDPATLEPGASLGLTDNTTLFNLKVLIDGQVVEDLRNLTCDANSPRNVRTILENESRFLRVDTAVSLPAVAPPGSTFVTASPVIFDTGTGSDGASLLAENYIPGNSSNGLPAKTGVYALDKADIFNLLCLPVAASGQIPPEVISSAAAYCVKRRAMLIVDPLPNWTSVDEVLDHPISSLSGPNARNAAVYFPMLKQANPLRSGSIEMYVPCGAVAGLYSTTDATRGVWKAPAGVDAGISGIDSLSEVMSDDENGRLNPLGINCLRTFPVIGTVVWGARTMRGADQLADEYKYIPVRRTALFIEESLFRGTKWVVFEPNDEQLWSQIRLNVGAFMHDLFRQGAFQGQSAKEAYFVKCDKETTLQNDINRGIVNILVGFAPLKPAEFVVIKLQQMAGQIAV